MTKAIRSYPESERAKVAARRLNGKDKGLGYWAAKDFEKARSEKKGTKSSVQVVVETAPEVATNVE